MILETAPMGFPWPTLDPFLFCAYHLDDYPAGAEHMGPASELLDGRMLGQDFTIRDGWRMYHGRVVPGFPRHPHRGFETITVARHGVVDHSDSLGARARYGDGDCQWMTAGRGIVHAEMFPLRNRNANNKAELFQLWLNLPARNKMTPPAFKMMWAPQIPTIEREDASGRRLRITVTAGTFEDVVPPSPPADSWAAQPGSDVAIWTVELDPGAEVVLPQATARATSRMIYAFRGTQLAIGAHTFPAQHAIRVEAARPLPLSNVGSQRAEVLLLQGAPIGESVAHAGPFVMNTRDELQQAYEDFRRTQFGGWPWERDDPVFPREQSRVAIYPDGRRETP